MFMKNEALPRREIEMVREASNTRPAVWIIERDGIRAVVKDFRGNRFLYRNIIGRFLVWREKSAYRKLRGLKGVPALYGQIGGLALVLQEIKGRDLEDPGKGMRLSEDFFRELRALVTEVHKRGLAHCDLKRASNVLLGNDGRPYIVDWSSAISERECRFFPLKTIYRRFILDDFNAITKLQFTYCPEKISPEEKKRYQQRSRSENLIRGLRDKARVLLKKIS